ncbi:Conserved hypothetical protein CHP02464 (plasmid) [Deinococcus proteolyticus MRP]|uniref:NADAR domain-containing protein n=1 Tax=Deinococcus proteolyticus (strain ATCC 35074 / DSM 20540 / JCM 6276 / NBRC 101906 / NCIMB 13154 / VKM Ac-1939 / CCM 2703 / MRP) TaxID=693977 RepID=F0RQP6_DEIPM|nr:NADAR domain-containing protein [Deinococcus proteolyticus]ADY27605.1 Conserved hypothetical protein CHP02464 [Deinococcus proteolyticus MRP]
MKTKSNSTTALGYLAQQMTKGSVLAGTGHRPDKLGGYGFPGLQEVTSFTGPFSFLGNFHSEKAVRYGALQFQTLEAAFQAAKTGDVDIQRRIAAAPSPKEAKAIGRALQLREDWEDMKEQVMLDLLREKFSHRVYREQLLGTGLVPLIHNNAHKDAFWGVYKGEGQNRLGKLLMQVREEIRAGMTEEQLRCFGQPQEVLVEIALEQLQKLQPSCVITGMALGWDTALAIAADIMGVPFVAAVPFPGQANAWPKQTQKQYHDLLGKAKYVVVTGSNELAEADIKAAMQWRNEFMVDNCTAVLAMYDGTPGGTHNCVEDAKEQGVGVINAYPAWANKAGYTESDKKDVRYAIHPQWGRVEVLESPEGKNLRAVAVQLPDGQRHVARRQDLKAI